MVVCCYGVFFFFKQKTAYDVRICDWSSDVCSSDLLGQICANLIQNDRFAFASDPDSQVTVRWIEVANVNRERNDDSAFHDGAPLRLVSLGQHGFEEACICVAQEKDPLFVGVDENGRAHV